MKYLILILISLMAIVVYLFHQSDDFINPIMIILTIILTYFSLSVAKCYSGTVKFALNYVLLGIMFALYAVGEFIYYLQGFYGTQSFPNWEDIIFTVLYIFGILYVVTQMQFYKVKPYPKEIIISVTVGVLLFVSFLYLSWNYEEYLDFLVASIGMAFVSTFFAFTILATLTLRNSKRYREWLIVSVAIGIYTLSDLQYYVTESIGEFSFTDICNYGWFIGTFMFLYVLLKLKSNPNNSI